MKIKKCFDGRMKGLIRMMRKNGFTYEKIGKIVHCGRETARRYCTKY
jgi:hypothetical protein